MIDSLLSIIIPQLLLGSASQKACWHKACPEGSPPRGEQRPLSNKGWFLLSCLKKAESRQNISELSEICDATRWCTAQEINSFCLHCESSQSCDSLVPPHKGQMETDGRLVSGEEKNNDTFSLGCRSPPSSQACPPLKIDCERPINAGLCQEHPHVQSAGLMEWMLWISLIGYKKNESGGSSRVWLHNLVPNGWRVKLSTGEKLPFEDWGRGRREKDVVLCLVPKDCSLLCHSVSSLYV